MSTRARTAARRAGVTTIATGAMVLILWGSLQLMTSHSDPEAAEPGSAFSATGSLEAVGYLLLLAGLVTEFALCCTWLAKGPSARQ